MKKNLSIDSSEFKERIKLFKKQLIFNNKKMQSSDSDDDDLIRKLILTNNYSFEINGEKQYQKAIKGIEKKKQFIEKEKEKLKDKEFKELRKKPKINKKSILLSRTRSNDGLKIEDRLIQKGKEMEQKKLIRMKQLSFDFGNRKNKLKKYLQNSKTCSNLLYKNAFEKVEQRKQLIDNYYKKFTFKPKISKRAHDLSKEKYQLIIKKEKDKTKKVKEEIEKENNSKIFLFKDKTIKKVKKLNDTSENNYNSNYTKDIYEKEINKNITELKDEKLNTNLLQKSQWLSHINQIVIKTKNEKYKKLFDMIGGSNGNLSKNNIIYPKHNIKKLNDLTNLLDEIKKEDKEIISFKEFCIKADKYFK